MSLPPAPGGDHVAPAAGCAAALLDESTGRNGVTDLLANPHFARIGGEAPIRALVERFYRHMDTVPEARTIRALHPVDIGPVKEVFYQYLVGWTGGPQIYAAQRGQPRLRKRHSPYLIGAAERDAWMKCMTLALAEVVAEDALRNELQQAFYRTASFLRNQPEST